MNQDHNLDRDIHAALRAAFRTESAPPGFAARVEARLAAAEQCSPRMVSSSQRFRRFRTLIAAALVLAIILPLGFRLHHRAAVARGEAARQQVLLALRITGTQLRAIEARTRINQFSPSSPTGVNQ